MVGPENQLYKALIGKAAIPAILQLESGGRVKVERIIQPAKT